MTTRQADTATPSQRQIFRVALASIVGSVIEQYDFLVTGITGLQLLGAQGWVQDVFYGGALVIAVTLARLVARRRQA